MKIRIHYYHTDCGGVVYYARYLEFLEEARTEFLEERSILVKELIKNERFFVVARQEIDYKLPAFYGDILTITTRLAAISTVKMEFGYEIENQDKKTIATAKTVLVWVGKDLKPKAIPEDIRKKLEAK